MWQEEFVDAGALGLFTDAAGSIGLFGQVIGALKGGRMIGWPLVSLQVLLC